MGFGQVLSMGTGSPFKVILEPRSAHILKKGASMFYLLKSKFPLKPLPKPFDAFISSFSKNLFQPSVDNERKVIFINTTVLSAPPDLYNWFRVLFFFGARRRR